MKTVERLFRIFSWALANFKEAVFGLENAAYAKRASAYTKSWKAVNGNAIPVAPTVLPINDLRAYFDANTEGNGIFKFLHYFDVYERHFRKFVGKEVHIVDVGVYSGGSLKMWQHYFGEKCKVYGVDLLEECKNYESENVEIFIGDQENRDFWKNFKEKVPRVDILIDDGGHLAEQQIATLEEILPHLSPGGVYLCEDVSGSRVKLTAYMNGIQNALNSIDPDSPDTSLKATPFQQAICSIHQYPYVFVIEKNVEPVNQLSAVKMGTIWNPFLSIK